MSAKSLTPAVELARKSTMRFPNENADYRRAREALLAEEIELRRHIERVAQMRRALPLGGAVTRQYLFGSESGQEVSLDELFAGKQSLLTYSYMFGPQRSRPCPMCTSLLSAWDGEANDVAQQLSLAIIARSPLERLVAFKRERGWRFLRLFTDLTGEFSRDYHGVTASGDDIPAVTVFTRREEQIHHFWSGEMGPESADPGQDPRGAPDLMPLWTILDMTPEGRDPSWYPKLEYAT